MDFYALIGDKRPACDEWNRRLKTGKLYTRYTYTYDGPTRAHADGVAVFDSSVGLWKFLDWPIVETWEAFADWLKGLPS